MQLQHPSSPNEAPNPAAAGDGRDMAAVLRRNIQAMRAERERAEAEASATERLADRITRFTGSLGFVAVHVAIVALWIAANLGWLPHVPRFDPTFVILATAASVEAIFLTTFVLISQNRGTALAERRAALDLQINLLAEYEITQLVRMVRALGEKLGAEELSRPELEEIAREVVPEAVLKEIEADDEPEVRGARSR